MEKDFWQQAWNEGRIGFHQSEYTKAMKDKFDNIDLKGKTVLLPLAGKTKDILYFLNKGAKVIAVEIVEDAIKQFFNENEINYKFQELTNANLYEADNLKFFNADFFKSDEIFKDMDINNVDYIFDRASNVALPKELRIKYYQTIKKIKDDETKFFIITFMHDGPKDFGPPFLIPKDEIKNHYKEMDITLSCSEVARNTKLEGRFKESGMTYMAQLAWTNFS